MVTVHGSGFACDMQTDIPNLAPKSLFKSSKLSQFVRFLILHNLFWFCKRWEGWDGVWQLLELPSHSEPNSATSLASVISAAFPSDLPVFSCSYEREKCALQGLESFARPRKLLLFLIKDGLLRMNPGPTAVFWAPTPSTALRRTPLGSPEMYHT